MRHEIYENGLLVRVEELPDPEPTETELLQAQIDALLILLAQDAT